MASKKPAAKVRLTLDVSDELNERLNRLAADTGGSKADVLRKAIALVEVAVDARKSGDKLAVINSKQKVVSNIVGV